MDGESITTKVEKLCQAAGGMLPYGSTQTSGKVQFSGLIEIQKWLKLGYVDFAEIFRGFGEATIRVREAGLTASEGFAKYAITYERCWHLDEVQDQKDCAFILVHCLRPLVTHIGVPCRSMSQLGSKVIDNATAQQNKFALCVMTHQEIEKLGVSVENPKGTTLFVQPQAVWV